MSENEHDPCRHVGYLRQALESPKRPTAFLIGAGCPLAIRTAEGKPLIPAIAGMTEEVIRHIEAGPCQPALEAVRSRLTTTLPNPTIEDYLSQIRMLREVVPHLTPGILSDETLASLDRAMCDVIYELANVTIPEGDTPYHHLAAWISGVPRGLPVQLFTTNYDLLIEESLEAARVPFFDGFAGSKSAFFDPSAIEMEADGLPPRWARLWKLHGSVNWWLGDLGGTPEVIRTNQLLGAAARLIYPSHLKYDETRQMPYLAMMDRLKAFLRRPSAILVCCGFSFSDRHINSLLRQALSGNADATVFGLMFERLSENQGATGLARMAPNLSVLARDGAVVGTRPGLWRTRAAPEALPIGVRTTGDATSGGTDGVALEVTLGDFAQFGLFLQDLLGRKETERAGALPATSPGTDAH